MYSKYVALHRWIELARYVQISNITAPTTSTTVKPFIQYIHTHTHLAIFTPSTKIVTHTHTHTHERTHTDPQQTRLRTYVLPAAAASLSVLFESPHRTAAPLPQTTRRHHTIDNSATQIRVFFVQSIGGVK